MIFMKHKTYVRILSFLDTVTVRVEVFPPDSKIWTLLFLIQYHGNWWPEDAMGQGISSHDADLIQNIPSSISVI